MATAVTINCAGAGGRGGTVHRAQEEDRRQETNFTPLCPAGEQSASRGAVTYETTDRLVNCGRCLDLLAGGR